MLAEARGHQRRRKQISTGPKIPGKLSVPQFCLITFCSIWGRHVVAIVFKYIFILSFGSKNSGALLPWVLSYSYAKRITFCHWT